MQGLELTHEMINYVGIPGRTCLTHQTIHVCIFLCNIRKFRRNEVKFANRHNLCKNDCLLQKSRAM